MGCVESLPDCLVGAPSEPRARGADVHRNRRENTAGRRAGRRGDRVRDISEITVDIRGGI